MVSSKKPSKQRKRVVDAKLHVRSKFIASHLSKELRDKYKKRAVSVRKGDVVKVMCGKHKNKTGKISKVNVRNLKVTIEGILIKRKDGREVPVKFDASNLMVTELYKDDEKRFKARKQGA